MAPQVPFFKVFGGMCCFLVGVQCFFIIFLDVFSVPRIFLHRGAQKAMKRKITIFEAHMQPKVQFTAYYKVL